MRLYLSSYRLGNRADELRGMASGTTAVVITNALDFTDDIPRKNASTAREIAELTNLGFSARELDLRRFFGKSGLLLEELHNVSLLWLVGGNAFLLRRALMQSGLDEYLWSRKRDPSLLYGGYSAGAIVATPTLRGIERVDSPSATAEGYEPAIVWDGLGLVPYSIAPHYQSSHPDSDLMDAVVDFFTANEMPFRAIRDGEVIITDA
jgi:dipeptidase E